MPAKSMRSGSINFLSAISMPIAVLRSSSEKAVKCLAYNSSDETPFANLVQKLFGRFVALHQTEMRLTFPASNAYANTE